jgi:D-arabinitol dehydrogenase (NADP+)
VIVELSSLQSQTDDSGYSLMLSQLLKLNGASKVVIAANKGIKMDIAKELQAADVYIELDR